MYNIHFVAAPPPIPPKPALVPCEKGEGEGRGRELGEGGDLGEGEEGGEIGKGEGSGFDDKKSSSVEDGVEQDAHTENGDTAGSNEGVEFERLLCM